MRRLYARFIVTRARKRLIRNLAKAGFSGRREHFKAELGGHFDPRAWRGDR